MAGKDGISTGELARETGIPQQTLISWDRSGVLKASRPGRRSSERAPRVYDENAVAAALFAAAATRMAFRGKSLKEMLALVQGADRSALEAAAIVTYRNGPGLMTHYFTPDIATDDVERWLQHLRDHDALVEGPTTLWTMREHFLRQAENLIRTGHSFVLERLVKEIE